MLAQAWPELLDIADAHLPSCIFTLMSAKRRREPAPLADYRIAHLVQLKTQLGLRGAVGLQRDRRRLREGRRARARRALILRCA
jgi:hypothetical protein